MRFTLNFLLISLVLITATGCEKFISVGNSHSGYQKVENAKIQPEEAVKLAASYLDKTFELRIANSEIKRNKSKEPSVFVTMGKDYYHIVKESYPSVSVNFYLAHAVKVHKNTGEIIPPK